MKSANKYIFAVALVMLTFGQVFSQETEEVKQRIVPFKHQIGVNINNLLQTTLGVKQDSANASPYLVTYRISKGSWGVRLGLGGYLNHEVDQEDGFADKIVTDRSGVSARIGIERQRNIHQRWMVAYGLDVVGASRLTAKLEDSGFDQIETINQYAEIGAGPSLGLFFGITKRIYLSTEVSIIAAYTKQDNARTFKNFPELNDNLQTITAFRVRTILPANLYLVYQF